MYTTLSPSGPIKWNHNQESSLIQDVSPFSPEYDGRSTTTLSEKIRELYLQFLWLPEVRHVMRRPALHSAHTQTFPFPEPEPIAQVHHATESIRSYGAITCKAFCQRRRRAPIARRARRYLAHSEMVQLQVSRETIERCHLARFLHGPRGINNALRMGAPCTVPRAA